MKAEQVIQLFRDTGALLEGHFLYTSGRHGRQFLQAARVLQYPGNGEALGRALAAPFEASAIDLVIGPATGGIILAYETARQLGCRAAYTEKADGGGMALKRGFRLKAGERVLVVEDVITTGGSVLKSINHLIERGAEVIGVSVLIDRSAGKAQFPCPFHPVATLAMESWPADDLPPDLAQSEPVDPDDLIEQ
ncbi:MAG: orotate phosphoribosyltransferase [Candidatus Hydrogenedentes bacterium]|jgi:orotate phosphoribosyltransferase|nr:orotate phosphoribosyltransferase [Candidatus Hydrogenedentota bacterium]